MLKISKMRHLDRIAVALLVGFALTLFSASAARAGTITYESGGISSLTALTSTEGTYNSPWTIGEEMTAAGALAFNININPIDGTGPLVGAPGTQPVGSECPSKPLSCEDDDAQVGFHQSKWVSKTIKNETGAAWASFRFELLGEADGLSFANTYPFPSPVVFESTKFSSYSYTFDTWGDYLTFYAGVVAPGDLVTFKFVIVDTSENALFSLHQTPTAVPEPATLAFLGTGLLLLGAGRRVMGYAARLRQVCRLIARV